MATTQNPIDPQTQYTSGPVPFHVHSGTDAPRVDIANIQRFSSSPAVGDIVYWNGNQWASLKIGTAGQTLHASGTTIYWA